MWWEIEKESEKEGGRDQNNKFHVHNLNNKSDGERTHDFSTYELNCDIFLALQCPIFGI